MTYTPITDEEGVKDAFAHLQTLFHEGAEGIKERPRHPVLNLSGELHDEGTRGLRRYWISFKRKDGSFTANVRPKNREQDGDKIVQGLFVKDEKGHRFLTHGGSFNKQKSSIVKFREFTGSGAWIDVEQYPEPRFVIARIDNISAPDLVQRISAVLDVVLAFKNTNGDSDPPLQLDSHTENSTVQEAPKALNTILYGPPGTGKTYATARRCVEICDGPLNASIGQDEIRRRYKELVRDHRVEFITFHQSYGYEEFVEGLRPETGAVDKKPKSSAGFRLVATPGVLKRIADRAREASHPAKASFRLDERRIFKMGLGNPERKNEYASVFMRCIEEGLVLLDKGREVDWSEAKFDGRDEIENYRELHPNANLEKSDVGMIHRFRNEMKDGDIVIVSAKGNKFRAIGEIVGPYKFLPNEEYKHGRAVQWHWRDDNGKPFSDIYPKKMPQQSICLLEQEKVLKERLLEYINSSGKASRRQPYVLIIDEINRANISKVMGELITLLEEDKREGAENEISVTLPYSGKPFTLPANLHILGTMNTADRSIALIDTALRRRFQFEELAPMPDKLKDKVEGIELHKVLQAINDRLEHLIDRDHLIGHAWLMQAKAKKDVDRIMRHKVIPLIVEYFYDDWRKARAVLGGTDHFIKGEKLPRLPGLEEADADEDRYRWSLNEEEFSLDAYSHLIQGTQSGGGNED